MQAATVLRRVILLLSSGAMLAGIAVLAGWLVPRNLPDQFRIPMGVVILLYGAYRFFIAWFRTPGARSHEG
jgi:hypothetical protein